MFPLSVLTVKATNIVFLNLSGLMTKFRSAFCTLIVTLFILHQSLMLAISQYIYHAFVGMICSSVVVQIKLPLYYCPCLQVIQQVLAKTVKLLFAESIVKLFFL